MERKSKMNLLKVRDLCEGEEPDELMNLNLIDDNSWSSLFKSDNIDEFQLVFKSFSIENEDIWFKPQWENNMAWFLRVVIQTIDQATIFITFVDPEIPFLMIYNNTKLPLTYFQGNLK